MSTIKRGRGRPPGTGLNDHPTLNKVADVLLANPRLKPTTAMGRVLDKPGRSTVRRLQVKWRAKGEIYLAEAEARRAAEQQAHRQSLEATIRRQSAQAYRASRGMGAALAALDSPAMRAIQEALNSPAMRAMRELQDSPTMRALNELQNSPAMRAVRELHNSPTMRAMQEAMNSPGMRALQDEMRRSVVVSEQLKLLKF